LKRLGVTIVLDDFGSGQSSISRLGRLPIDTLKVDLRLIGAPVADHARKILHAIAELAGALELRTVAECIEDDDTWNEIAQIGFDLVQVQVAGEVPEQSEKVCVPGERVAQRAGLRQVVPADALHRQIEAILNPRVQPARPIDRHLASAGKTIIPPIV
jgi:EAL domain-containing protein (putative c-di-GMP-specific phosphodiesterase class I)